MELTEELDAVTDLVWNLAGGHLPASDMRSQEWHAARQYIRTLVLNRVKADRVTETVTATPRPE